MTDLPPRRRGRPTNEEKAAREAAVKDKAKKDNEETAFLDEVLAQPIKRRNTKLQPEEDTLRTIGELAKLFCTQEEVAGVLGVCKKTFGNFLNEYPEAREVWDDGLQHAKVSLRRKQLSLADKNAPAAIFLGKNYLAQKDESTINQNVKSEASQMTEDQLLEIASRGVPAPKPTPKEKLN
ncbi:hypothetical protein [Bradyrhizobium ottawaense]|uniref:Uncharacterized protein n=1 Tax=Bradyrhizobium ottawaense TaxID=931866 RepID=A0ABY0QH59_9BRAD|nr:hypothetical protein [Bradyrhizobium ottawaense]SDK41067.1 hypothetical protein SAMN05444163_8047 [Bradyrhizobium ottawaense]